MWPQAHLLFTTVLLHQYTEISSLESNMPLPFVQAKRRPVQYETQMEVSSRQLDGRIAKEGITKEDSSNLRAQRLHRTHPLIPRGPEAHIGSTVQSNMLSRR